MSDQPSREAIVNRVVGALLGAAVGDSIATEANGLTPYEVHNKYQRMDGGAAAECGYSFLTKSMMCVAQAVLAGQADKQAIASRLADAVGAASPGDVDAATLESVRRYSISEIPLDKASDDTSTSHHFLTRLVPVGICAARTGEDDVPLGRACRDACGMTHSSAMAVQAGWVVAKMVRDSIRNFMDLNSPHAWYQADHSPLAHGIRFLQVAESSRDVPPDKSMADRLLFARRRLQDGTSIQEMAGLMGNRQGIHEVVPFSVFCFLRSPGSFNAVVDAGSMGGAASCNAALVGAMAGAFGGAPCFPEDVRRKVRNSDAIVSFGEKLAETLWR